MLIAFETSISVLGIPVASQIIALFFLTCENIRLSIQSQQKDQVQQEEIKQINERQIDEKGS